MNTYHYDEYLESERLITRKLTMDDVPAWTEFFSTPETTEFLKMAVLATPEESARVWIERQMNRYANGEYGHQALLDKKTNEFMGMSGLILQDIDGSKQLEVGYHVLRKHWGKGYAPEAARLFLNYGFKRNLADSLISIIHIDNIKSQRVADKNGLTRGKQLRWKDLDVYIYCIDKGDWQ
jgi:ribosomal-protein-alanine N-acetyltransferase